MESSIYHESRAVRTKGDVLRTDEFPSNLPNDDERDLCRRITRRMGDNLYGRYSHPYPRRPEPPPKKSTPNPRQATKARPVPQTGKVPLRTARNGVLGSCSKPRPNPHGQHQITRSR